MSPAEEETVEVECAGCRQSGLRRDLERFVYHESTGLVFDMRGGAPGRAAFVHPLPGCIRAAAWAGFSRSFETPLREVDGDELVENVRQGLRVRFRDQLREASRMGDLSVGRGAVERLDGEQLEVVLNDEDAGRNARQLADRLSDRSGTARFEIPEGVLTEAVGRKSVIAGLTGGQRAEAIGRTAEKLICIAMNQDEG